MSNYFIIFKPGTIEYEQRYNKLSALSQRLIDYKNRKGDVDVFEEKERADDNIEDLGYRYQTTTEIFSKVGQPLRLDYGEGEEICVICYRALRGELKIMPCQHRYHLSCIDDWFNVLLDYTETLTCPLCRFSLGTV